MKRFTSWLASLDRRSQVAVAVIVVGSVVAASAGSYALYQNAQPTLIKFNLKDGQSEVPLNQSLVFTTTRPVARAEMEAGLRIATGQPGGPTLPAASPPPAGSPSPAAAPSPAASPTPLPAPSPSTPTRPTPGKTAEGHLHAAPDGRAFTWIPTNPWLDLTQYTVRLAPRHDASGHQVKIGNWKFSTTLVPRVLAVTTDSGITLAENAEVGVNSALRLNFNTTMDQPSIKVLLNNQLAQLSWDQTGRTATFSLKGFPVGPVDMSLGPGGRDTRGHNLPTDWDLKASLVFQPDVKTIPLAYPALVQIPNDNYGARDQSGLSAADFVYEFTTEGGITRLAAVFTRAPEVVGPVRSARLISIKLTRHYHGRLFLSGTSQGTFGRLLSDPVPTGFEGEAAYFRSSSRPAPDNLYIQGSALQRAQTGTGGNDQVKKGPVGAFNGEPATSFAVPDHNSTYAYDPQTGTYAKTEDGRLMSDALIGQPVHIQMVVVMHTSITTTSIIEDANGARGLDFDLESGGRAEFYYMGKKASGRWAAPDRKSGLTFALDGGQALNMPIGVVWVEVVS